VGIITIGTPFNIDLEFKIASLGKRLLAWFIDIIVVCVYYYLMWRFVYPLLGRGEAITMAAELFLIIPVLIYQLAFELLFNGQTVGKMLAGIKVIDKKGHEPTWGQYITRWMLCLGNLFLYILPYQILQNAWLLLLFMMLYTPDFFTMIISSKTQRIGDFAAGTVVIDRKYKPDLNETIYLQIENKNYQPMFPQVMRLTDRDINGIRNLLNTKRPTQDTEQYMVDVALKIKSVLEIESNMYAQDFLQQLLRDYNYFTTRQ
jgi:uncharacterized RDD family membrane protein YckC